MRGAKCKALRRMCWTDKPNRRNRSIKDLKAEYCKGVSIGGYGYYPRQGRDWRELLK